MRAIIRLILKLGILFLLFPIRIFPIKKNRILLLNSILNFDSKYGCNPKYITEYILGNYKNKFEIIYPLGKKQDKNELISKGIKVVELGTLKYYYYAITSKVFITTSGAISYIPFRKKQIVINTWHGGGAYKKMGLDNNKELTYKINCKMIEKKTTYFVSSNKIFSKIIEQALLIPKNKILEIGLPRNDIFFYKNNKIIKKVKKYYNLPDESKIILYAPTYRTKNGNQMLKHELGPYELNYKKILKSLKEKFGGEWHFALRVHPSLVSQLKDIPKDVINMSDYDDVQELLYASDILINDYSSIMWDFVQTRKPCFIYATDLKEYENSAGLYTKPSSWPFPLAETETELLKKIEEFDDMEYQKKIDYYFEWMENFETGEACKKLVNIILKECGSL
ncbi:CDP-glycerol glycerophosphotransferase family protein [Fusobacterium mortiferum]|uniref:CDP-glycerol glycerophosphotransferase family protein n=1 Tax=Fusobacterium mortiferum TaxID=850 RepID=UPI000E46787C|nr:CDP-glycerol glycerophosphotransferase family protein [Fusobacterium mortiferum]RHF67223.1 CDP-glycerol glycerophosphotransferase [Fusobacterium mortiferum]